MVDDEMVPQINTFTAADPNGCGANSELIVAVVLQPIELLNSIPISCVKVFLLPIISFFFPPGKGRASV